MEIVIKINNLEDINILTNADAYLLANKHFSYRYKNSFNLNDIKKVKKHCLKNNKKVYILLNKIFKDKQLDKLKTFMEKLKSIDVDGYYFIDFAVFMIARELNISDKCIFYHETFLRNTYDIITYQQLGIKKIICSKDMNLENIKKLPQDKKDTYGIICFGYIPLYESQRKILTHYASLNNLNKEIVNSFDLTLKENTRNEFYKVIEQNGISSIFDSKVLSYLKYINILKDYLNIFIVDSLFFDTLYIYQIIELIKEAASGIDITEKLAKLDKNIEFSDGFLNKKVGLV